MTVRSATPGCSSTASTRASQRIRDRSECSAVRRPGAATGPGPTRRFAPGSESSPNRSP
jgi:hypothetical protein